MLKVLVIFDCHRPWHNRKAYALMLTVAAALGIDTIVIIGDYGDIYWLSRHEKHPMVRKMFEDEIKDIASGIDELDQIFPLAKKVYIEGNHEFRLTSYLTERAQEIFNFVTFKKLVGLEDRPNWTWVPWGPEQRWRLGESDLWFRHRPPATNPRNALKEAGTSLIYGDVHKIEEAHKTQLDGRRIFTACGGWMGDDAKDEIFGYVKNWNQWQLGFSLVYMDPKTWETYYQNIHIHRNITCMVNGKLYRP